MVPGFEAARDAGRAERTPGALLIGDDCLPVDLPIASVRASTREGWKDLAICLPHPPLSSARGSGSWVRRGDSLLKKRGPPNKSREICKQGVLPGGGIRGSSTPCMARTMGAATSAPNPLPLLPSPTGWRSRGKGLLGEWVDASPRGKVSSPQLTAQEWWRLTQESRHRQRLPSRPAPQSRDVAHSPAGSRWPTRAVGDIVAQKSDWATPRLEPATQVMLTWEGEHSSGPKRGRQAAPSPPWGPQE